MWWNVNFMDFTQHGQASWLTRQLITSMIWFLDCATEVKPVLMDFYSRSQMHDVILLYFQFESLNEGCLCAFSFFLGSSWSMLNWQICLDVTVGSGWLSSSASCRRQYGTIEGNNYDTPNLFLWLFFSLDVLSTKKYRVFWESKMYVQISLERWTPSLVLWWFKNMWHFELVSCFMGHVMSYMQWCNLALGCNDCWHYIFRNSMSCYRILNVVGSRYWCFES